MSKPARSSSNPTNTARSTRLSSPASTGRRMCGIEQAMWRMATPGGWATWWLAARATATGSLSTVGGCSTTTNSGLSVASSSARRPDLDWLLGRRASCSRVPAGAKPMVSCGVLAEARAVDPPECAGHLSYRLLVGRGRPVRACRPLRAASTSAPSGPCTTSRQGGLDIRTVGDLGAAGTARLAVRVDRAFLTRISSTASAALDRPCAAAVGAQAKGLRWYGVG